MHFYFHLPREFFCDILDQEISWKVKFIIHTHVPRSPTLGTIDGANRFIGPRLVTHLQKERRK